MRAVFTFSFLIFCLASGAQIDGAWKQVLSSRTEMQAYQKSSTDPGRKTVYLSTPFGKAQLDAPSLADSLRGKLIEKVELVYTRYASSESFNQQLLNQSRLRELQKHLPDAFSSELTEWTSVVQTGASDPSTAKTYFHGFAVTYRPEPTKAFIDAEFDTMVVRLKESGIPTATEKTPMFSNRISGEIKDADFDTFNLAAKRSSLPYRIISRERFEKGIKIMYNDTIWLRPKDAITDERPSHFRLNDSVVTTTLWRNLSGWQNSVIICDLTASMSPYSTQLLAWLNETAGKASVSGFVLYNDGDNKDNTKKKIGKTGGIYTLNNNSYLHIFNKVHEVMKAGSGGDVPENTIEAIIEAQEKFSGDHNWILIADNLATPRDLELLEKVKNPIRVVLCGAKYRVNANYLEMAWKTGGSVHITGEDYDLSAMREGQSITIGKFTWKIEQGHFVLAETPVAAGGQ